jgi:excisionase family DNA binding protein
VDQERQQLLTASEAAQYLRISLASLRRMEKGGYLVPFRTVGGHRRYSLAMLNDYLERSRSNQHPPVRRPSHQVTSNDIKRTSE